MTRPTIPIASAEDLKRRRFLKLMAASAALAGAGCSGPPAEPIVPYVDMPENQVPGLPVFYATAFVRRGLAHPVLVETNMGRPTKVEGHPGHPESLGATDPFAQASVLQLWDPDRSQLVRQGARLADWESFEQALAPRRAQWERSGGAGVRLLLGPSTSPALALQLEALVRRYPALRWQVWDPLHDDDGYAAAHGAFGRAVDAVYRLEQAAVVLAADADLFGQWPGSLRLAREFTAPRRLGARPDANRLYVLESSPTLTGAYADNRMARAPAEIERALWRIAARLGAAPASGAYGTPDAAGARWEAACARALAAHRGQGLVAAGPGLSPATRALAHHLNAFLGNAGRTVHYLPAAPLQAGGQAEALAALAQDMHAGRVDTLLVLGANPVYDAPADLDFGRALARVPFSAHLGLYRDETGRRTTWHLPLAHAYEQWGDARAADGSVCIVQPLVAPLYGGRAQSEVLALLLDSAAPRNAQAMVRSAWPRLDDAGWREALRSGVVPASIPAPLSLAARAPAVPVFPRAGLALVFRPDPATDAGEFANNAWLQELPRPLSQLTWDNALLLGPATAARQGLSTGDLVQLDAGGRSVQAPVLVQASHAEDTLTLPLGYGRTAAGAVGDGVGFNAYAVRTLAATAPRLRKLGARHDFAFRQQEMSEHGRGLVKLADVRQFRAEPNFATGSARARVPDQSMYPPYAYPDYKWGMAIDLNACIGCGACTVACQAENNIPVVGKQQVQAGRAMHWIRVDRYEDGGRQRFQPVPCMHCEDAPCEEVCPVGATVHDDEGLNVQVYNRCVGTRFCSNNCPYKVRRFNFLEYAGRMPDTENAQRNPEVTVRRRGVMEKCSYCLQRITRARIEAEKQGRRIADGEVVTACQAVCPTQAIAFGDLNDPRSAVRAAKSSPLDYALLAELNTHPRTTYAARVVNPDPEAT
ncbi:MAG: 4Fe-4S dicluster domain-containing protein [Telluria sp.]